MTDKVKIVDKIRKLLSLAKSNSSIEEAASATAKAQALMEEYRIHQAMLNNVTSDIKKIDLIDKGHPQQWKAFLASMLSSANGCCIVQSESFEKDNKVLIIGELKDVETIQALYSYISTELQKLCVLKLLSVHRTRGAFPGNVYTKSFFVGALHIVKERLEEAKALVRSKVKNKSNEDKLKVALARIDSKTDVARIWANKNLDIKIENIILQNEDRKGYSAGVEAGRKLDISSTKKLT